MSKFLQMVNIQKNYGGVKALKGVDFSIDQAEIHCLIGENGSGKSTLIKIISGDVQPDGGEIQIEGRHYPRLRQIDSLNLGIRVIYQDFALFPNLTVAENIAYSQLVEKGDRLVNWQEIHEIAKAATEKIQINLDLHELVGNLSVANQQMVAICRALTKDVRLLILDEPTSALSKVEIDQLFKVVFDLQSKGISIMFVSHKLNEVLQIAHKVSILRDGEMIATLPREEVDNDKLIQLMSGRKITYTRYKGPETTNGKLLEVKGLTKKNNFADVSFSLGRGEILGITGLLGSGRTELALALYGIAPADRGSVVIDGKPVTIRSVQDAVRAGIGYVPEDRLTQGLVMKKSVRENVVPIVIDQLRNKLGLLDNGEWRQTVDHWIDELGIKVAHRDVEVRTLSGGNQQKVVLSKWLASKPKILILDNPTAGVDVAAKSSIYEVVRNMAEQGVGVILISDEIPEVVNNCNRILIMRNGRLVEHLETQDVTEEEVQNLVEMTGTQQQQISGELR